MIRRSAENVLHLVGGVLSAKLSTLTDPFFLPPILLPLTLPPLFLPPPPSPPPLLPSTPHFPSHFSSHSPFSTDYSLLLSHSHFPPSPSFSSPNPFSTPSPLSRHSSLPLPCPSHLNYQYASFSSKSNINEKNQVTKDKQGAPGDDDPRGLVLRVDPLDGNEVPLSSRFLQFLEDVRGALAGKDRIHGVRVLLDEPEEKYVNITLESKLVTGVVVSVTLKLDRTNGYCIAFRREGVWYRLKTEKRKMNDDEDDDDYDDDLKGAEVANFGINYLRQDVDELETIGSVDLQTSVQTFYHNGTRKSLMNIVVHIMESARFTNIAESIADTMEVYSVTDFPDEFKRLIHNWGKLSKFMRKNKTNGDLTVVSDVEEVPVTLEEAKKMMGLINSNQRGLEDAKKGLEDAKKKKKMDANSDKKGLEDAKKKKKGAKK